MKTGRNNGKDREVLPITYSFPPTPTRAELEKAGIRIVVAIPMERTMPDVAFAPFWAIAQRGWPLFERLYGRTDVQRNQFARKLLETDFTHVMMLDMDHIHPSDIVERHARWVLQDRERMVIGGLHFRRGEPFDPCVYVYGPDGELHSPAQWEQGLYPVRGIGHGSLLVDRRVFGILPSPWWAYNYAYDKQGIYPSEDMWFCYSCRKAEVAMYCDTTITSPHLIANVVDEDVFRAWLADNQDKIRDINGEPPKQEHKSGIVPPDMVTRVDV